MNKIKVLVVDDSSFMRKLITDILEKNYQIEVIGVAKNGREAIEQTLFLKPDVITMDVSMPVMNGIEALRIIMKECPTPVIMLSSTERQSTDYRMVTMANGAADFIAKPGGSISLNLSEVENQLVNKIIKVAQITFQKTVTSVPKISKKKHKALESYKKVGDEVVSRYLGCEISQKYKSFVIIGTSTGGPRALQEVLTQLPPQIGAPILIVQHMPKGFTKSLAERLNRLCRISVKEAEQGELIEDDIAYIAPGGSHLKIKKEGVNVFIHLDKSEPPRKSHRPAIDVLFESAAHCNGIQFITVILTGMGDDGKEGLAYLKNEKSDTISIAESEQTAVIYGMPKAVIEAQLVDEIVEIDAIANVLQRILIQTRR